MSRRHDYCNERGTFSLFRQKRNGSLTISVRYRETDIGDTVSPTRYGKIISIMKDSFELHKYK